MKKLLLLLSLLFFTHSYAQIGFEKHLALDHTNTVSNPASVVLSDIDNDGDKDLVSALRGDNKVVWYENIDGAGIFGDQQIISTNALAPKCVFTADFDGDGYLDVLVSSIDDTTTAWYKNIDGQGVFDDQPRIIEYSFAIDVVEAVDIDGDGDFDIIGTSENNTIVIYENFDGQGSFSLKQTIWGINNEVLDTVDFDGDGDIDVLCAYAEMIYLYKNIDGQGNFDNGTYLAYTPDPHRCVEALKTADMNGDGFLDVIYRAGDDDYWGIGNMGWFENIGGTGVLGPATIIRDQLDESIILDIEDIDGDGDNDVFAALWEGSALVWFENLDGNGNFSGDNLVVGIGGIQSVAAADIDGDNDIDIVLSSSTVNQIIWSENTNGQGSYDAQHEITDARGRIDSVICADIDNDNDNDIVFSFRNNKISWLENVDGEGSFGDQKLVADINSDEIVTSLFAVDLDADGDNDILSIVHTPDYLHPGDRLYWYENLDGLGNFGSKQQLTSGIGIFNIHADDIDGDEDIDIILFHDAIGLGDSRIALLKNDGFGNFEYNLIAYVGADWSSSVFIADFDLDGDKDFVLASYRFNIAWYENVDGNGDFENGYHHIVGENTTSPGARSVFAADFDGDGDMDIVSTRVNEIIWLENLDGQGNFGPIKVISNNADNAMQVKATDMDNDGDMDVLSASYDDDKIAWYENLDGLGNFGAQQIVSETVDKASEVYAKDVDNDGNMDIVTFSTDAFEIIWYENTLPDPPIAVDDTYTIDEDTSVELLPLTGDSDPDGDTLTITSINGTTLTPGIVQSVAVPNGTVNIDATGIITFIPDVDYNGTVIFPYVIIETNGGRAAANQIITVLPINDDPIAVDDTYTLDEDTSVELLPLTGDSDPEGDTLTITSVNGTTLTPGTAQTITIPNGTVVIDAAGIITFTPEVDFNGPVVFSYAISDTNGGTAIASQIITVLPINDDPIAADDTYTLEEDTSVELLPLAGDSDPEGDTLTIISINTASLTPGIAQTITVPNGTVTIDAAGVITFTPDADYNGSVTFPYVVNDANGGTATANQIITVLPVDEEPIEVTFTIYPNPTTGILTIASEANIKKVFVSNILGQLLLSTVATNTIDISEFNQGLYVVKVIDENGHLETGIVMKE